MKSNTFIAAELTFRATKRAATVQNSSMWVERITQAKTLEELCKVSEELRTKHVVCKYPKPYAQAAEEAASALIGKVLNLRITEQNRLEMLQMLGQQRSNLAWLQRACFHYGL